MFRININIKKGAKMGHIYGKIIYQKINVVELDIKPSQNFLGAV